MKLCIGDTKVLVKNYWTLIIYSVCYSDLLVVNRDLINMEEQHLFPFFTVVRKYKCIICDSVACNTPANKAEEVHVDCNEKTKRLEFL